MTASVVEEDESPLKGMRETPTAAEIDAFAEELARITDEVRRLTVSDSVFRDLLRGNRTIANDDNTLYQAPETFTKKYVIDELLEYLGYPYGHQEINTPADDEDQWVDYVVPLEKYPNIDSTKLLIEAEPINKRLDQRKHGVGQVRRWLHHEPFESSLGMATDGIRWIFLKKDPDTHTINRVEDCDLTDVFLTLFEAVSTGEFDVDNDLDDDDRKALETFYGVFAFENFIEIAPGVQTLIRQKKSEITDSFYEEYIEIVLGITDESSNGRDTERCLVGDGLDAPVGTSEEDRRLFAVQLMNRLIFIKFIEDTELAADGLLNDIRTRHEEGSHLTNCYTALVKPLIYDVFNTPRGKRSDQVKGHPLYRDIPYLNGGLFRENLDNESAYSVSDSILLEILEMLERYQFSVAGTPDDLDPSILGTVFEKTINYLAGDEGTQKDLGAYYTPDKVTQFCAQQSVKDDLLEVFKETLADKYWRQGVVDTYDELYDLIDGLPSNQHMVDDLLADVNSFYVLDPACGSGHFLTSILHEIIPIRRALYEKHERSPHTYQLKKNTVLENLYGVDIVGPGVEITKLRLWLSIISELSLQDVEELDRGELALPNVAFNIREGNSLVGYTDTARLRDDNEELGHQQSYLEEYGAKSVRMLVEERQKQVNRYKTLYGEDAHEIEREVDKNDERYNRELNEKLVTDLREAEASFEYEMNEATVPDLPPEAIEKITIRFKEALGDAQKEQLDERFRTEKGMRINRGGGGYVSVSLSNQYLTAAPENRLETFIDTVADNVSTIEVERYLTVEDIEELESFHWPLEFYEVFDSGGFDVVISNPPYGISLSEAESALGNYPDENHSSMVFATRAEDLIHHGGSITFVVPKLVTYGYRWTGARQALLERNLRHLIDLGEAFDGVKGEQIILRLRNGEVDDAVTVGRLDGDEFVTKERTQAQFTEQCFYMWADDENEALIKKLHSYETIDDVGYADATKGIDYFDEYRTHTDDGLLGIRGDNIGQFQIVGETRFDESITDRSDVDPEMFAREKVVWQDIIAHVKTPHPRVVLQAAIDREGAYIADTAIFATSEDHSLEYLCGLLNSSLFSWFTYNLIHNRAIRTMHFTPTYFGQLPVPPEDDEEHIGRIEKLTAEIETTKREEDSNIMATYERLNEAVYDLYRLTEDERELVEKEVPAHEKTLRRQ